MDYTSLVKARKCLDSIWQESMLKGRCWGLNKKDNPYGGSNINLAEGKEAVFVSQKEDGSLKVHEFVRTKNTKLGRKIKETLRKNGLSFNE